MKIQRTRIEKGSGDKGKSAAARVATGSVLPFADLLAENEGEGIRDQLAEMLKRVDELGRHLARAPTAENLEKYKEGVGNFLKNALPEILRLAEIKGADIEGRQKIYLKIEKIQGKIQDFTDRFLKREQEKFNLVERMDEIRGLVVDLYR